jgi:hypothetical protein
MEDNHCVIMDKYSSNLVIAKIQMASSMLFRLTWKPTKKKNTMLDIDKGKSGQLEISFTE